ncbi:restriction endonuclease subunit S [Photobacterium leiognathi]|uniref:restriction endonuclease subunit S n=1 Tax=Photobacterium leiognathi TaxID=553611 RepID=UPI002981115B|nr:restriction endonuclease subunit S [Photobacterium leiognathi]
MNNLRRVKLGSFFTQSVAGEWGSEPTGIDDVTVYRAADFSKDCKLNVTEGALRSVPKSKLSNRKLNRNDILVEKSGGSPTQPVGRAVIYKPDSDEQVATCSNFLQRLVVDDDYSPEFVYYLMLGLYQANATLPYQQQTTGIYNLKLDEYLQTEVETYVDRNLQEKVADILSTIDNQIDATQALIDKYTAIKQGMMADLFSRGIDPETKALRPTFEEAPELYQKTPLGMLPKGWDVIELQTVATVERGKFTHRPRDDKRCYGGEYPFIQTGDVAVCVGNHLTQYKQTLSDFGRSVSKEFPVGTVAVTIAANIADTAILAMPMCFPDSVVGVVVDERLSSSRFVELCIRMSKAKLDALAPQSAQKNINLEDLRPLKLPFPSRVEQELVCSSYEAINDPVNSLNNEKKKLIAQKSGLMQDLLTGKVPVPA